MLPRDPGGPDVHQSLGTTGLTIRVDTLSGPDSVVVERFLKAIQVMRQYFNGHVLTIRGDDVRTLAILLDETQDNFTSRLVELGVAVEAG